MKVEFKFVGAQALVALIASVEAARHGHISHRHEHAMEARMAMENHTLEARGGNCPFPTDAGLVAVTPNAMNGGWAMSPDQPCKPGNYCPYACPPGQVSMQWDPKATSYSYPQSMNGGLYCDEDGQISKPFPDKPYCADGTGAVQAMNKAGKPVAFCQTVLPGNEAMLIPTLVEELSTLAVPGTSYWCETAAQYYVNAPGVTVEEACVWGSSSNPVGNWSPFTAGANTVSNGDTYLKIGWNPIYLEPATPFRDVKPDFGIEILCDGDGCNGLPCRIDPSSMGVNRMKAPDVFTGAGGATGCVVTVPSGAKAQIVVFDASSDGLHLGKSLKIDESSSSSSSISSSSSSTTTSSKTSTSTSTVASTTSTSTSESSSTHSSTSSTHSATSTVASTSAEATSTDASSFSSDFYSTQSLKPSSTMGYTYRPHVFTGSADIQFASATTSSAPAASTSAKHNSATSATVSFASVVIGAIAALVFAY
ncbi:Beta-glucosidase (SUN family) [Penicillium ucsense]|uniref:Beta-glucosidase (SUN family) n=1 Tax=Penicillium ucsense TaxID=2839758 RepID=A0A8J8W3N4_9EURO|nr:Beta-glucosidase (SUN family) [Penicillium ucsense]KAF7734489.1 Beta-glucosidase (SUN family) [Penicillium ucsense]